LAIDNVVARRLANLDHGLVVVRDFRASAITTGGRLKLELHGLQKLAQAKVHTNLWRPAAQAFCDTTGWKRIRCPVGDGC
jgi:hypothetical protein